MNTEIEQPKEITYSQAVEQTKLQIRELVSLGPEKAKASSTELIMAAFATCDRERWLPMSYSSSVELWWRLDQRQRDAVVLYLGEG